MIVYRPIDWEKDFDATLSFLCEALLVINNEVLEKEIQLTIRGKTFKATELEARLWYYLESGHEIHLALDGDNICGILIFNWVFENIAAVKILYCRSEYRSRKVAIGLVRYIEAIQIALFQTMKALPPNQFLGVAKNTRLISEGEKFKTWEMKIER